MVGWSSHPPAGQHGRRPRRAVLLRPPLLGRWIRLRPVRNLLVPADPVRPVLAVPHRLLRPANVGRWRMGPQGWLGLRPGRPGRTAVLRRAGAGVAQEAAWRAAPVGHDAATATSG